MMEWLPRIDYTPGSTIVASGPFMVGDVVAWNLVSRPDGTTTYDSDDGRFTVKDEEKPRALAVSDSVPLIGRETVSVSELVAELLVERTFPKDSVDDAPTLSIVDADGYVTDLVRVAGPRILNRVDGNWETISELSDGATLISVPFAAVRMFDAKNEFMPEDAWHAQASDSPDDWYAVANGDGEAVGLVAIAGNKYYSRVDGEWVSTPSDQLPAGVEHEVPRDFIDAWDTSDGTLSVPGWEE